MSYLILDALAKVMITLIIVVGVIVVRYSYRYMSLEKGYYAFFSKILLLLLSITTVVCSNFLPLFFLTWVISNLLLVQLIKTNDAWPAAVESSRLALQYFSIGFVAMALSFGLLGYSSSSWYITGLSVESPLVLFVALGFLFITACIQSALWPFNMWLLSSLNAPTSVSAFMHAGLVNGGCFLLIRFAHLYIHFPVLLNLVLIVGLISALAGVFFKLIQTDVKRMLACSTMAQMGFVFVQCGAGLYSSALAHVCWHSIFKAYLFLSAMTVEHSKSENLLSLKVFSLVRSAGIGLLAVIVFTYKNPMTLYHSSSIVLVTVAFVASAQMALTMLHSSKKINSIIILSCSCLLALLYRFIDSRFDYFLGYDTIKIIDAHYLYIFVAFILLLSWLSMVFFEQLTKLRVLHVLFIKLYVWGVRSSMPHIKTLTLHRRLYRYK